MQGASIPDEILELIRLQHDIRKRFQEARQKIAANDFDGARQDIEILHSLIEGGPSPSNLAEERDSLHALEESLANAIQVHQEAQEAQAWEAKLQSARSALAQGDSSKARDLAQELLDTPGISDSVAAQSRELIEQSRALDPISRRAARKLTITGLEIHPQVVTPGGRAVAVAHATVSPAFEQATTIYVIARVMKNLDKIAGPIDQVKTVPAGGGPWKITIPINIPRGTAAGNYYVDIKLLDPTLEVRGSGGIGFTIRSPSDDIDPP